MTDLPQGVRVLTLSNPTRRNALDKPMLLQLREALTCPPAIRALLIRAAANGAFCAGYDLNELATLTQGEVLPDDHVAELFDVISNHPLPSVALVTGAAFGAGCELAMACDVRIGDSGARFCMPPLKLGLVYSQRGFARFVNRVGPAAARFLFLTGAAIDAERALQLGLLSLIDTTNADAAAVKMTVDLAAASPMAVEGTKLGLQLAIEGSGQPSRYHELHQASFRSEAFRSNLANALKKNGLSNQD